MPLRRSILTLGRVSTNVPKSETGLPSLPVTTLSNETDTSDKLEAFSKEIDLNFSSSLIRNLLRLEPVILKW